MQDRAKDSPVFVRDFWRTEMGGFVKILRNLVFPPRCACCREILPTVEDSYGAGSCLCEKCYGLWNRAKDESCPECLCASHKCLCAPSARAFKKSKLPKLLTYSPNINNTQNKMIYALKKTDDKRICEFVADELSVSMESWFKDNSVNPDECIYTYVPRRASATAEFGFDQGKRLSQAVCKIFGGKFESVFLRIGGTEQKQLDKNSRARNIDRSLKISKKAAKIIKGKTVVIIDDLVTTGATLDRAMRLAKKNGAKEAYVACVARTCETKK